MTIRCGVDGSNYSTGTPASRIARLRRGSVIGLRHARLEPKVVAVDTTPEMRDHAPVRYTVEHFRAIDADDSPLGVAYVATGQVDEVDAEDESAAAAIALTSETEVLAADVVSYNPADGLYGVAGEDEAVRVSSPHED
jgi:hypothetical protein